MSLLDRIAADAAKFTSPGLFGQSATWKGTDAIDVLFNEDAAFIEAIDGMSQTTGPAALCKASDVNGAAKNDALVTGGQTYYVARIEPAGPGLTLLVLSRTQL